MSKQTSDAGPEIDSLFQLPLPEFTGARNALAARLKKQGRRDEAEGVKSLLKPPVSAWTVNQLYWRHRKELDALLEIGERFRKAQAAQLAGRTADVRTLLDERREALAALTKRAGEILASAGHNPSPDVTRRITTTLDALATYGNTAQAPPAGRLTDDIDPPGFEALAALVPRGGDGKKGSEPPRVLQFRREELRRAKAKKSVEDQEALRAKAREAVAHAEAALREAQRDAARAEAALKKAAALAKDAQKEKEETEKRFEKAQAALQEASRGAHRVAREAEEAAQTVADAERALEKARQAIGEYE